MPNLKVQRVQLAAGSVVGIVPPAVAHKVTVGNATADDLRLYDQNQDLTQYVVVGSGFERELKSDDGRHLFNPNAVAFYVNAIAGGSVVLQWI